MKAMLSMYEADKLKEFKSLEKNVHVNIRRFTALVKRANAKPLKKSIHNLKGVISGKFLIQQILVSLDKLHSLQKDCPSFETPLLDDYKVHRPLPKVSEDEVFDNPKILKLALSEFDSLYSPKRKAEFGFYLIERIKLYLNREVIESRVRNKQLAQLKAQRELEMELAEKKLRKRQSEKDKMNAVKPRTEKPVNLEEYKAILSDKIFEDVFFIVEGVKDVQKLASISSNLFSIHTNGAGCSKPFNSFIKVLLNADKIGFILTDPDKAGIELSCALMEGNPKFINLKVPLSIASKKYEGVVKPGVEHADTYELMKFIIEKTKPYIEKIKQARKEEPTMSVNVALEQPVESERKLRIQITRSRFSENMDNDLKEGLDLKMSQIKDLAKEFKNVSYGEELIGKIAMIKRLTTQAIRYDNRNFELTGKYLIEKEVAPFMRRAPQRRQSQEMLPSFYTNRLDTVLKMISESACPYKIRYLANKVKYLTTKLDELKTLGFESEEGLTEDLGVDM